MVLAAIGSLPRWSEIVQVVLALGALLGGIGSVGALAMGVWDRAKGRPKS